MAQLVAKGTRVLHVGGVMLVPGAPAREVPDDLMKSKLVDGLMKSGEIAEEGGREPAKGDAAKR